MKLVKSIASLTVSLSIFGCAPAVVQLGAVDSATKIQVLQRVPAGTTAPPCFQRAQLVELKSSKFNRSQLAYYFKARAPRRPLVVSLHSWGTTYAQEDPLAQAAQDHDWNYIHPDYGGAQFTDKSCCYPESIQDIEDAAAFGVQDGADPRRIAFIGKSGGGTGVLAGYLQSKFSGAWYLAWAPIPDQVSWHDEVLKNPALTKRYLEKILEGTKSTGTTLNVAEAKLKSPFYFDFSKTSYPQQKKLRIYAGLRDGLDGWSTSLSQPLNFYNKLVANLPERAPPDASVDKTEFAALVNDRRGVQPGDLGSLGSKRVVHRERFKDIELVVFDGGHEIITEQAVKDLEQAFIEQP